MDRHGNFFGTAESGGGKGKRGTVFELTNKGALQVPHRFTGPDGEAHITSLVGITMATFMAPPNPAAVVRVLTSAA